MDWGHVLFAAGQGTPALVAITITLAVFSLYAKENQRLRAMSSSLACLTGFLIACLLGGIPGIETSQIAVALPFGTLVVTLLLVVPSVIALRHKWLGVLHIVTVAAALYLSFVAALAISHDAT